MDFRVDLDNLSPCEALYEQLSLLHRLGKNQCFILINIHAFFSPAELAQLYKMTQYQKMNLLLLESYMPRSPLSPEDITLFDADLCELTLENDTES